MCPASGPPANGEAFIGGGVVATQNKLNRAGVSDGALRAQGDRGELGGHATNALDGVQQRALPR